MADTSEPDQPVAGPSRLSPRQPSPRLPLYTEDVTMEMKSGVIESGPHSQEAAELLLGFSTIEPRLDEPPAAIPPPLDPPSPGIPHTYIDPPKLVSERQTFPYTPPDDPPSHVQIESAQPSSPADPSLPPKPRQKRKRAIGNTPNRRTSTDPARPPHFMGEDNEVIRCICGIDEDDGLTIQCESCYAWQHALCFGYADAESAPEIYYCELCAPRSFDGEFARERQVIAKGKRDNRVQDPGLPGVPGEKKPRGKAKRARVGSVHEDADRPDKDPSPGTMAPPSTKPRRKPGPKPKPKVIEPSPAPSYTYIPPPTDAEDDYFRVEPWSLEYTPVRDNVIRGRETRRVLSRMYREWVDIEEEEKRRSMGPSGLPSPTETGLIHLSPDLFPLPDFSILAPPVPPVPLLGPDLDSLASPTIIKSISPSLSFLPLSYSEATPLAGPYHRPALYGVFSSGPITSNTFIGEYRSEVIDSETYRLDPINQYSILGMLKPHVHPIGPPVNLMLDSRGYGSELRFIRSGCHPNVVLRPFLFRVTESDAPKLRFGVFASRDISPEEELVLGWTWDDSHLVHSLRSHLHPTILPDGYPGRPLTPPPPALLDKFEAVLTHFLGTFSSCACRTLGNCSIAQMRFLVEIRDEPFGEVGQRANLGVLVGATRGWRRGEEEKEKVRRWNLLDLENGWETVRRQRPEKVVQGVEEVVTLEEVIVDSREETEDVGIALEAEMDEVMESASEAEEGEGEPEEAVEVVSQSPLPNGLPSPVLGSSRQAPSTPPRPATADAVSPHSEPASPATSRLSTPPPARARSSPQLGSQSGSGEDEQDEEVDDDAGVDGNESDATTATVPRSPSDVDMDEPDLRRSTSPSPRSKPKLDSPNKRQYNTTRPTSTSRRQSESSSDSSEPDTAPAPVTSRRDPSRPYKISRFRKDGKEDKRFKSRPAVVSPAGSVAPKRQKKRIISSPITEDDSAEVRVNGKHTGEDIAASLFPEVKEVVNEETGQEGNPPTPPPPLIPNPPRKSPTPPLMPNPPPKSPTPPPRIPTPPPEPAKKVSISEWLRKRNEEKIERDRQMAAKSEEEGAESQVQAVVEAKEEVKMETAQEGQGFNIHDFLPSSRPSQEITGSYGSTLYESPRIANVTPNGAYIPRTEYFPTTTPRNSSYVPRASVSTDSESAPRPAYVPRAVSTPVEEPQPLPEPNGHAPEEYGGYLASRAARSVSVTIPTLEPGSSSSPEGTSQDEPSSMPPPLAYREPPPHQQPPRSYPSASLSPETRTTVLASPSERTSPLPRLPPTGPKAVTAPTGPRGVWPTPVTTTGERSVSGGSNGPTTPITPTAPSGPRGPITHVPVPGMGGRGGFGGRGMFEPRASWRGRHFGTRGGWR